MCWFSYMLITCVPFGGVCVSSLCAPMGDEDRVLGDAFLTLRALVGLFPSVCLLLGMDAGAVVEAFPTCAEGWGLCPLWTRR